MILCSVVVYYQDFENVKIISQIVSSGKWCVQNGERVQEQQKLLYLHCKTNKAFSKILKIWDSVFISASSECLNKHNRTEIELLKTCLAVMAVEYYHQQLGDSQLLLKCSPNMCQLLTEKIRFKLTMLNGRVHFQSQECVKIFQPFLKIDWINKVSRTERATTMKIMKKSKCVQNFVKCLLGVLWADLDEDWTIILVFNWSTQYQKFSSIPELMFNPMWQTRCHHKQTFS